MPFVSSKILQLTRIGRPEQAPYQLADALNPDASGHEQPESDH
jgi:hypothetical protein